MKCQSWIVDTSRAVASCCTTTVRKCCDCCPQLCGPPIKQAIKTNEIINTFLLGEKKNRPAMMSRFRRWLCFSCVAVDTVCVLSQTMHRLFCLFFFFTPSSDKRWRHPPFPSLAPPRLPHCPPGTTASVSSCSEMAFFAPLSRNSVALFCIHQQKCIC